MFYKCVSLSLTTFYATTCNETTKNDTKFFCCNDLILIFRKPAMFKGCGMKYWARHVRKRKCSDKIFKIVSLNVWSAIAWACIFAWKHKTSYNSHFLSVCRNVRERNSWIYYKALQSLNMLSHFIWHSSNQFKWSLKIIKKLLNARTPSVHSVRFGRRILLRGINTLFHWRK